MVSTGCLHNIFGEGILKLSPSASPAGSFLPHQYLPRWTAWRSQGHTTSRWSRKNPSLNHEQIFLELEPIIRSNILRHLGDGWTWFTNKHMAFRQNSGTHGMLMNPTFDSNFHLIKCKVPPPPSLKLVSKTSLTLGVNIINHMHNYWGYYITNLRPS